MNLDSQKRIIYIQKLGPDTTRQSLMDYFSEYPIERCSVPLNAAGKNAMLYIYRKHLVDFMQVKIEGMLSLHFKTNKVLMLSCPKVFIESMVQSFLFIDQVEPNNP
jgi:hypothetical protein